VGIFPLAHVVDGSGRKFKGRGHAHTEFQINSGLLLKEVCTEAVDSGF